MQRDCIFRQNKKGHKARRKLQKTGRRIRSDRDNCRLSFFNNTPLDNEVSNGEEASEEPTCRRIGPFGRPTRRGQSKNPYDDTRTAT